MVGDINSWGKVGKVVESRFELIAFNRSCASRGASKRRIRIRKSIAKSETISVYVSVEVDLYNIKNRNNIFSK